MSVDALYVAGRQCLAVSNPSRLPTVERARATIETSSAGGVDDRAGPRDLVVEAEGGVLGPAQLTALGAAIGAGKRAWLYWPRERAVETVDRERLRSYRRLRRVAAVLAPFARIASHLPRRARAGDPASPVSAAAAATRIETGDDYKDAAQAQWDENPVGSHYADRSVPRTLDWFHEIETHRYRRYAPWMPAVMEFDRHAGEDVLEIGGGIGTDLAQFARHGARVTDVDLSGGHLRLAEENFRLRRLTGRFIQHDAETLPFPDASFDLVYSHGVLHHTPDTARLVGEVRRVLRPGGRVIAMLYAESSWHYWRQQVWRRGLVEGRLRRESMGEILSQSVEISGNDARPLVKVYTRDRVRALFAAFQDVVIMQRQLTSEELPLPLRPLRAIVERVAGWNLIVKAVRA